MRTKTSSTNEVRIGKLTGWDCTGGSCSNDNVDLTSDVSASAAPVRIALFGCWQTYQSHTFSFRYTIPSRCITYVNGEMLWRSEKNSVLEESIITRLY